MNSFYGLKVHVSHDHAKRKLPDEVIPGVIPWPPGFKDEMDAWLLSFFGTVNLIKDGDVIKTPYGLHMNPRTLEQLEKAVKIP